jgi:excisionase family DNA binding protein
MTIPIPATDDLDLINLDDPVLKVPEAARLLGDISEGHLCRMYHRGEIAGFNIGRRIFFRRSHIEAYIAKQTAACPANVRAQPEPRHLHLTRKAG